MPEIKFDLGKDIVETARASGVSKFETRQYARTIIYDISPVPPEIPARFVRPGYEIVWSPLYSFSMYASEKRQRQVDQVDLGLSSGAFDSHEAARAFVEQTIAQFQKGKWKRHIGDACPAVTGRSSLLDEMGQLTADCSADPEYEFTREEWLHFAHGPIANLPKWEWIGDGVFAQLEVQITQSPGDTHPKFRMSLEFQIDTVRRQVFADNVAHDIEEGKAKGWDVEERIARGKIETAARIKVLEANALKRGDRVVER
ncbi:MAG TPA: hypothetical protein VNO21_09910 [Polyangiaceae bacterium]|nr:hypothetical protein [Polyangiaceae bacterium]